MQISVSGRHLEITNPLRTYIDEKFNRLERHFDKINSLQVILSPEHNAHKAESTIMLTGTEVHASAEASDMYAAIDLLTDKLDRQILKHKNKTVSRNQRQ